MRLRAGTVLLPLAWLASCGAPTGGAELEQCVAASVPAGARVLVFSRTAGYRHESIPAGVTAIRALGERHGFAVRHTEDLAPFAPDSLSAYAAVIFLNTTGDVLDAAAQTALEAYVRDGGGFAGVHSAADTEYDWAWYGQLIGAYFRRHPAIQQATVHVTTADHPSTHCVPARWSRRDEWYDFRALPAPTVTILATVDESTYEGGTMGSTHPIAWYHGVERGRAWYTAMGHTTESYADSVFLQHLGGGIMWAAGFGR